MVKYWRQLTRVSPHKLLLSTHIIQQQCSPIRVFATSDRSQTLVAAPQHLHKINRRITNLIRSNRLEEARTYFDNLRFRNTVTWNSMLTGYIKRREIAKARKLFDEIPERDIVSWNLIISGYLSCCGGGYIDEARFLFDQMRERDFVTWNTMISGYAKSGRMDEALRLFNRMQERNVVSWNAMITGFLQNGDVKSAIELFLAMPERDAASLSALVSGLVQNGRLDDAMKVLFEFGKKDDGSDDLVHAYNTLIAGYGQKGRVDDARRLFDCTPCSSNEGSGGNVRIKRNVVSWNSMIMCYVKAGDIVSARELFDRMVERDTFSWNTLISGYVHMSDMDEASKLFFEMPNPDTLSWNSIISGYSQTGNLELARYFFERMPQKNKVSWNSLIAGCEKNGDYTGAIELFLRMQAEGEKPDRHTLSSLLSICAEAVALQFGMQIHQLVIKIVIPDSPLNNSLITMYARCGEIAEARAVFDAMESQRDVISWNAIIGGYASHGFALEALELFELMKKRKVGPTYITFISVLNACAHAGLVEKGQSYFKSMVIDFGIEPRVEHFAALVDVLGRCGQLEEAMDVIKSMPVGPDKAVWGALLGACRLHNNVQMARVAAEALMRLEPESSGPYVLLHNMYVDVGRWDDANDIRKIMDRNNIAKKAGYSRVDSNSLERLPSAPKFEP